MRGVFFAAVTPNPPTVKPRNPWIAGLLSLLFPGLGHIYAGAARRGMLLVGGVYLMVALLGVAGQLSRFWPYAAMLLLLVVLEAGALVDAVLLARRRRDYAMQRYNHWAVYVAAAIALVAIPNFAAGNRARLLGYETYIAPSASMTPALKPGELFLADTRGYGGGARKPARGEVIAFLFPPEPGLVYVKRVVAVGPAKVALHEGRLLIDGKAMDEPYLTPGAMAATRYSREMAEVAITADDAFVLGDNRDNSNDSRMWGAVPLENILGRATDIWWSDDRSRIGTPVR